MKGLFLDPDSGVVQEAYAVVYAPQRRRERFPESCVRLVATRHEAVSESAAGRHLHPAKVVGPSRSSEGVRLYYLVGWLD